MTMGTPQLTESRKVKRPVPCTIGQALITICADSRSASANAFTSADSVVGVWVTNLGAPVVPDVVSRTAGASLSGSGGKRPAPTFADEQRPPGHGAPVGAARAGDEALLLREDLRLDGLDVGIKLLLAKIESGLQALEDLAQFGSLEPQVRRARDRSDTKTRIYRNRHFGPVRHVEYNPVSWPNTMGQECARQPLSAGQQIMIGPDNVIVDEGNPVGLRRLLVEQGVHGSHGHRAFFPD